MNVMLDTARSKLEIRSARIYFTLLILVSLNAVVFQFISRIKITNSILTSVFILIIGTIAYQIYRRKKAGLNAAPFEWTAAYMSVFVTMLTKVNYIKTQDWTYAAQSYHLTAMAIAFIVITQFLYNKKLTISLALIYYIYWIIFMVLAYKNGVPFYLTARVNDLVIHDGIQILREIFFMMTTIAVTYSAYKNIPVIEGYDRKNLEQMEVINRNNAKISELLNETNRTAVVLANSTEQMAATISEFSDNAQSQAATAEEITATVEEVTASGESVYNNALNQVGLADKVKDVMDNLKTIVVNVETRASEALRSRDRLNSMVEKSKSDIKDVLKEMSAATSNFKNVQDTVNIIEDISDKINLLSLNAAIEAARAGDAGRGFAVVADEIGKLADSTSSNLKQISTLFNISNDGIYGASGRLENFSETLNNMINSISDFSSTIDLINNLIKQDLELNEKASISLADVMNEAVNIVNATNEQKNALEEISNSISLINKTTQDIAHGSSGLTNTSMELASMARNLKNISDRNGSE